MDINRAIFSYITSQIYKHLLFYASIKIITNANYSFIETCSPAPSFCGSGWRRGAVGLSFSCGMIPLTHRAMRHRLNVAIHPIAYIPIIFIFAIRKTNNNIVIIFF